MSLSQTSLARLWQERPHLCLLGALIPLVALTALLGFQAGAASNSDLAPPALMLQTGTASTNSVPSQSRDSLRQQLLIVPIENETPFWLSAIAPDPEHPRMPCAAVVSPRPSDPDVVMRTAALVREIESSPASTDNVHQLNSQVMVWYDLDPVQATEWLNATGRFVELSPALASIAATLGERGHLDIAHEIIENIHDETTRRRAVLDVYSLQARNGQISREALASSGWSEEDINLVFQGD